MNVDVVGPVFITGASGMLGLALTSLCDELDLSCYPYPEAHLDITDAAAVAAAIARFAEQNAGHGVVVNAAAFTDVDAAEQQEERAFAVNDRGARNVAEAAARHGMAFVHVSTDFVFDGAKSGAYTEQDQPNPLNAYGRSKLAGEKSAAAAHPDALVVRTAWVYGPGGNNFPRKIVELARERDELQVVSDEFGSPTASADLARGILQLWNLGATGLFHLAGAGSCSRYEMAAEVIAYAGLSTRLVPVSSRAFPSGAFPSRAFPSRAAAGRAVRPANSVLCLDKSRSLGVETPPWRDSLRTYVATT